MIEKSGWGTFEEFKLICDHCEDAVEGFTEFEDAVKYKKTNDWKSVKSDSREWFELCPECSADEEVIEEYRRK